jgi:hypothetical protein
MPTTTFGSGRWRFVRAFGRNPLVRTSDRVEAIAVALAVVAALLAVPIAATVGTSVYAERSEVYAVQTQTRHTMHAIVARTEGKLDPTGRHVPYTTIHARWRADGVQHTDRFIWPHAVSVGDTVEIWIDDNGIRVSAPCAPFVATLEGACAAAILWLGVVMVVGALAAVLRWRLARMHDAHWEREIKALVENHGGRTNNQW